MLYRLLRSISGIALRWFYSRIDVSGLERVPNGQPLLLAVNHPNALVDAMVITWTFPAHVVLTAKATLFATPLAAWFFRVAGVVPLIRQQDIAAGSADAQRNARAFEMLRSALMKGRAVMIFPEGVTGDHVSLAPLRTGAARVALQARSGGIVGLCIVPVGLTFERKDVPRTRVLAEVGHPINLDGWTAARPSSDDAASAKALTAEIERRLRDVTLNYETADDAVRVGAVASLLEHALGALPVPPLSVPNRPLVDQVTIARRVEWLRGRLGAAPQIVRARVDGFLARLTTLEQTLKERGMEFEDVEIALDASSGTRFVFRELAIVLLTGPIGLWGWLNHLLPFNLARLIGRRSIESAADPAMRTIVSGVVLVLLFYAIQVVAVGWFVGVVAATVYLVSLPLSAEANFYLRARLHSATARARSFLQLRSSPDLKTTLRAELGWIRAEVAAIDQELSRDSR